MAGVLVVVMLLVVVPSCLTVVAVPLLAIPVIATSNAVIVVVVPGFLPPAQVVAAAVVAMYGTGWDSFNIGRPSLMGLGGNRAAAVAVALGQPALTITALAMAAGPLSLILTLCTQHEMCGGLFGPLMLHLIIMLGCSPVVFSVRTLGPT